MFERVVIMANDIDRLGGVSSFSTTLAEALLRAGFAVELVGVAPAPAGYGQQVVRSPEITTTTLMPEVQPQRWQIDKSPYQRLSIKRRLRHRRRFQLRAIAVEKLRQKLREWGPETVVIITQVYGMEHLLEAGYSASDPTMPRVIGQYHGSWDGAQQTGRDLARVVKAYKDVDATVFLVPEYARQFRASGLNNTFAIANPVNPRRSDTPILKRSKKIAALARYDEEKSLHYLVWAWKLICEDFPEWSVHLWGEGAERARLQSIIDDHALPRITLEGKTDDVDAVLEDARINVLTSQMEGLPLSVIESGYHGVPSVAFDVSAGVESLVRHGSSGLLVEPNSVGGLANALRELMEDEAKLEAMSAGARDMARAHDPDAIAAQWIEFFKYMAA